MENASKALIIAGAILLSILIIGLGMYIYTQAAGVMDDTGLDQQEIKAYNEPFERYEGTTVKGATVKAMIDTVRNHNNANRADVSKMIELFPTTAGTSPAANDKSASEFDSDPNATEGKTYVGLKGDIRNGQQYFVVCGHDPQTGYVTTISFAETASGPVE